MCVCVCVCVCVWCRTEKLWQVGRVVCGDKGTMRWNKGDACGSKQRKSGSGVR